MNDTVKHSDDEAIVSLTYTWGMVGGFLLEHGRPATDRNIEALVAACGFDDRIENGMDSLFNGAYDEVEGQLYDAMPENLPDKPWYDRPNGEWVYNREKPADHHDNGEDESWYGTYCHVGNHLNGNQCWCCNTCSHAEGTCAKNAPSAAAHAAASSATTTHTKIQTANGNASSANANTIQRRSVCSTP